MEHFICNHKYIYLASYCRVKIPDWRRAVDLGDPDVVLVGHRDVGGRGAAGPRPHPVLRHHPEHGGRLLVGHGDVQVLQTWICRDLLSKL